MWPHQVSKLADSSVWPERCLCVAADLPTSGSHAIKNAIDFIGEHYAESIGLQDIAAHVHLSENYFSTLVREETGMNFLQYLNICRINMSLPLLRDTSLNISEIAQETGFPSPGYFTKIFRRFIGMTPSEYRSSV